MQLHRLIKSRFFVSFFVASLLSVSVWAQSLPKPKGPVLLTVSGKITNHNAGDLAEFDAEMLDALPVTQFATKSPWHALPVTYAGPALKHILAVVGAQGKVLNMKALNKYEIQVPVDDAVAWGPILARRANGRELSVRTKGPLLMIYPFDSKPNLKNDVYYTRSIWQLQYIVVE